MEEAATVISELKGKFRSQGQQIITYRRKLRQQVGRQEGRQEGSTFIEELGRALLGGYHQ